MALIRCSECGRDISSKAVACPGCGAPVDAHADAITAPIKVAAKGEFFTGTRKLVLDLAAAAIGGVNYRVDARDDAAGMINFTTGVTMGSWSGVSGTIMLREVEPYVFEVTGQAKQNVKGGQMVAVNLFNEANGKVRVVVDEMRRRLSIQSSVDRPAIPPRQVTKTADYMLAILIVTIFGLVVLAFTLMA